MTTEQDKGQTPRGELLRMVTDIVASYVRATKVSAHQVSEIIERVGEGLERPAEPPRSEPEPAVPVRRSVTPEYLICLEDGKKLKMLRRYLMTAYGMTPEQYRAKWGLPKDYPMVAPNYALRRSSLARASGLGRRQQEAGTARRRNAHTTRSEG